MISQVYFAINCAQLKILYSQLSEGNVILNTNEHSPTTGTPVSSESCKISPKHFGVASFLSNPLHSTYYNIRIICVD